MKEKRKGFLLSIIGLCFSIIFVIGVVPANAGTMNIFYDRDAWETEARDAGLNILTEDFNSFPVGPPPPLPADDFAILLGDARFEVQGLGGVEVLDGGILDVLFDIQFEGGTIFGFGLDILSVEDFSIIASYDVDGDFVWDIDLPIGFVGVMSTSLLYPFGFPAGEEELEGLDKIDNFSIATPVPGPQEIPEPITMLLISTGLLCLVGFRRKFRK